MGWRVVQERAGLVPLCLLTLLAVDVHEMGVLIAVAAVVQGQRLSADGLAGGGEPLFPFFWRRGFVVGGQQVVPALGAAAALGLEPSQGGRGDGGGYAPS